jgi:hypothetical protein
MAAPRKLHSFSRRITAPVRLLIAGMLLTVPFSPSRPADPAIVVRAEDGYLVDQAGHRLDRSDVGRRLHIENTEDVRGLDLKLAAIEIISARGQSLTAFQLEEFSPERGFPGANVCKARSDNGSTWLIPMAGRWSVEGKLNRTANGGTLACASGALGKCAGWGFPPWENEDVFSACVRMVRADYCGDGRSHTRAGVLISFKYRAKYPAQATIEDHRFEAFWGADGAHCVETTRVPQLFTVDDLLNQCPDRSIGKVSLRSCQSVNSSDAIFTNYLAALIKLPNSYGQPEGGLADFVRRSSTSEGGRRNPPPWLSR